MNVNPQPINKIQIRAQAELRRLAGLGDPVAMAHLHGYSGYVQDPLKFNQVHLSTTFTPEVQEVVESVRDNTVTIAVSANAIGKSYAAAHIAVWFYKVYQDSKVFLAAAPPEKNLKQILWSELSGIVRRQPHVFSGDKISEDLTIQRNKESFISGLVIPSSGSPEVRQAKFSGNHAPHLLFIVDEGDAVPPEVYQGIESCMSGGHARLLIMFNPRADRGHVAGMVKKKQGKVFYLSAFDHPNVVTGENKIPGAVTREKTIERINEMSAPLAPGEKPDIECFEVPEFLVGTTTEDKAGLPYPPIAPGYRKVRNNEFFYKVIGKYPPKSESQLISRAWVEAAQSRWLSYVAIHGEVPPKGTTPVCALDVADGEQDSDLNVLSQIWGTWIPRQFDWTGMDPDTAAIRTAEKVKKLCEEYKIDHRKVVVKVDATGVGAGVPLRLQRLEIAQAKRVMVAAAPTIKMIEGKEEASFYQLRDQLWWMAAQWLEKDTGAMLPPGEELADELCTPTYWKGERDGKMRVSDRKTMIQLLGRSPDRASSIVLLFAPVSQVAVRSAG